MTTDQARVAGRRALSETRIALALALLGTAVWPFAPRELPLHMGLGDYSSFTSSWVPLVALPWSFAAGTSFLARANAHLFRPRLHRAARGLVVCSAADLFVALSFFV